MERRGFLGQVFGGVAAAFIPVTIARGAKLPKTVEVVEAPVPDPTYKYKVTFLDTKTGVETSPSPVALNPAPETLVHSRYSRHRIQVSPQRALQFVDGRIYVNTQEDIAALRALQTRRLDGAGIWFDGEKPRGRAYWPRTKRYAR